LKHKTFIILFVFIVSITIAAPGQAMSFSDVKISHSAQKEI